MEFDRNNPLARLIAERQTALGLSDADVLAQLSERGVEVAPSSLRMWRAGAGIADRHRPAIAEVLLVQLSELQEAASERDRRRSEARAERACA